MQRAAWTAVQLEEASEWAAKSADLQRTLRQAYTEKEKYKLSDSAAKVLYNMKSANLVTFMSGKHLQYDSHISQQVKRREMWLLRGRITQIRHMPRHLLWHKQCSHSSLLYNSTCFVQRKVILQLIFHCFINDVENNIRHFHNQAAPS